MKTPKILRWAVTAFCLGLISCGLFSKKSADQGDKPAIQEAPKLVGRIASIPADRRFVLIQGYGKWEVEAGKILTTRGPDDRTANLRATGEILGEFAAADLQSGTVELGDAVYSPQVPKPPPIGPDSQPVPDEDTAPMENVQKNN